MDTKYPITVSRNALYAARVEYERRLDSSQMYIHLRVAADGSPRVDVEPSLCVSADEYRRNMPHTVTLLHWSGHGACELPSDWSDPDGNLYDAVDGLVRKLEEAGYIVRVED